MRPLRGKFSTDLIWNAGAFGLSALIGVLLNVLILRTHGAPALGVFNQAYALYILLSQLAVGGVHLAVQAFVPRELQADRRPDVQLTVALVLSTATALTVMTLAWLLRDLPGRWSGSAGVGEAFPLVIPGLLFFTWNKVLLSYHNGARRMRLFAVFQLLRFVLMLVALAALVSLKRPADELAVLLTLAEAALLLVLLPATLPHWRPGRSQGARQVAREQFRFGNRALAGNFLLDVNTRVDVFLLGYFLDDRAVGLYSMGATVAEGVMYLPVLFRNTINPVITRAWHQGGPELLRKVVRRNRRSFFRLLAPLIALTIPLFPVGMWMLGMREEPLTVWAVYAILVAGVALTAGHQPFLMLFSQVGRPGTQTLFIAGVFAANVLLNLALIPALGLLGSALATALSNGALVLLMDHLARTRLRLRP
ncbi:MAG TPA: oligosaccharide flippase family protein [Flavobacteriales bacterium]|nr:oligosaccharide flippase family protein [Flavobacteriales bacterium]HMR26526.1 oligosaccharide flippase family protein [Flavobacteriales bacterium]